MARNPKLSNEERAERLAKRIRGQVERGAGKGISAASVFLLGRVKEAVSIKAPRVQIISKKGVVYYKSLTKSDKDVPPRILSGMLRTSLTSEMINSKTAIVGSNAKSLPSARYPRGFSYPQYHEVIDPTRPKSGKHQFIGVTAEKYRKELARILGLYCVVEMKALK